MYKTTGRIILFFSIVAIAALPLFSSVASAQQNAYTPPQLWPTGYWATNGLVTCTGSTLGTGVSNGNAAGLPTCTSICDLVDTIINIVYFIISICFFILTPLFFAIGGIMMMLGGANPEMLSRGKSVLKSTAIGVVLVLCSYLIVVTFIGVFNIAGNVQVFGGSFSCSAQYPSS